MFQWHYRLKSKNYLKTYVDDDGGKAKPTNPPVLLKTGMELLVSPIVEMSNSALEKLLPPMDPLPVPVKMKVTGSALAVWANKMALAKKHTLVRTDFLAVEGIMVFSILVRKFVLLEIPGAIDYVRFSGGSNSYSGFFQVDQAKNALLNARTALPRNRAHRKNPGKSVSAAQKMHTSM